MASVAKQAVGRCDAPGGMVIGAVCGSVFNGARFDFEPAQMKLVPSFRSQNRLQPIPDRSAAQSLQVVIRIRGAAGPRTDVFPNSARIAAPTDSGRSSLRIPFSSSLFVYPRSSSTIFFSFLFLLVFLSFFFLIPVSPSPVAVGLWSVGQLVWFGLLGVLA